MVIYNKLSDIDLTLLLKQGKQEAFTEIYRRYWSVMYMHAMRMLRDEEDARDVVQELFTGLWIKAPTLNSETNISGYLYITTRNKILDLFAQKRVRANHLESLTVFLAEYKDITLDAITKKELHKALNTEIERLPAKMRLIFEMRVNQHLSYKEIALELGISDKTVKKQINNAVKIINPKLSGISSWLLLAHYITIRH